jgi:hypothetical protein
MNFYKIRLEKASANSQNKKCKRDSIRFKIVVLEDKQKF